MSPLLPSRPSLRFLKIQAKDLLKAHKVEDPACLDVLRNLRRFASSKDAEVLAATVSLKEMQFALAMHYGFKSWMELKEHVEKDVAERVTQKCWETHAFHVGDEYVLDDDAKSLNRMAGELGEIPDWAVQVRESMPKYGFELCSHRWVEGLCEVIKMIGAQKAWPTTFGHCGDVPDTVTQAALERADAVEAWRNGQEDGQPLHIRIRQTLGKATPDKIQAASCFVELVRRCFEDSQSNRKEIAPAKQWRSKSTENPILATMFEGEGFDCLLQNPCGYKIIDRLDLYIEIIGGDMSRANERHGVCVDQRRFILRDDIPRFTATRGYLWGLYAYITGRDAGWLNQNKPECVEDATYALNTVSQAGPPKPLNFWLCASLLKAARMWIRGIATDRPYDMIPDYPKDLPELAAIDS